MFKNKADKLWYGFIAVAFILPFVPGVIGGSFFGHVATMILLYAAMAQSWNIISGYCGQTSFGHSVFFGIGAYGAALAVVNFNSLPWYGAPLGMLAAAVVSVIISYPCFKLKGHYFAIATFAIVEIFNRLFMIWDTIGGALGLDYPILPDGWVNFSWSDTKNGYYLGALAIFILVFSVVRWIERHRMGYYLRAVREGQETAESLGVNSTVVKLSAMALSASLAALCGAFFAQYNYRVDPPMVMSLDMSMKFVLITILGGLGTFWGPFLGAPYISLVGVCRAPMAAAMFSKMVGEGIKKNDVPASVKKFGSTAEDIYHDMQDLYLMYGKEAENIPAGAAGVFSYLNRVSFGLRLMMALNRKFSLGFIDRTDLIPLTESAKALLKGPWL